MTRVGVAAELPTLVIVALRITGAHAAIESHAGVVPCAGQPESSRVTEQMDPSIDMALCSVTAAFAPRACVIHATLALASMR